LLSEKIAADGEKNWVYIDNGKVRIGVKETSGAAIGYFSLSDSSQNIINHWDHGRLIQQSYYGVKDGSKWAAKDWSWNPVQGGGYRGEPAKVLELESGKDWLYAKALPKHWATGVDLDEAIMEQWIILSGDVAHVRYKMTYTGLQKHPVKGQEIPAVFVEPEYDTLVFYDGESPWSGGDLSRSKPGWPNSKRKMGENWAAYVNSDDFGLGVMVPKANELTCYRHRTAGEKGACSYFAPLTRFAFIPGTVFEYDVYLTFGKSDEIRRRFQAISATTNKGLKVDRLRCEYMENPLGIDEREPRLSWIVTSEARGQRQTAYQIRAASSLEKLLSGNADLCDSGKIDSDETVNIVYQGKSLASRQACFWQVRVWDKNAKASTWSSPGRWSMGLLKKEDWLADWISFKDETELTASRQKIVLPPARYYRKEFEAEKSVRRATIYATALGIYELSLNGQRISDQMFTPGWSDYRKRVYYNTFDVTKFVQQGGNSLGAIVADGWYSGYVGFGLLVGYGPNRCGRYFYGKTPALRLQLEIEYSDGSKEIVTTDRSWKTSTGPILEADMLMGEVYDARLEKSGWDLTDFDDERWDNAIKAAENGSTQAQYYDRGGEREVELGFIKPMIMQAYSSVPVRPTEIIKPTEITEPDEGVYIFNMGQNFSGIVELKVKGEKGQRIQLRHGEMLHTDGRLMTENLRKARARDIYILKGDLDHEIWRPKFTYHGFQYVEVTGLSERPTFEAVTGIVIGSDTPLTSTFECSDKIVNQLFSNIVWTQRANFFEVPTDCPQRDERLGWTGDAQVYVRAATYNADVAAFFTKWEHDLVESQRDNGAYPAYAPFPMQHGIRGKAYGSAWMDAGIICPYTIYKVYGDKRIIERNYESMTRFMDFRRSMSPNFQGVMIGNDWGDWLALNKTPIEYIDSVYFAYSSKLMAEMARAIGKNEDAKKYEDWLRQIKAFFNKNYVNEDGSLAVNTQTAYAIALFVDMLPAEKRSLAGDHLARLIEQNGYLMSTGFIGTRPLLPVLTAAGHHDLAVRLLQNRRYPSWGYEVENGATSIWERWNSFTKDKGFMNAKMNSFSHYSFGAVCEWMFQSLAGIDTEDPGYKRIIFRPGPPTAGSNPDNKPIDWVKAEYDSVRGRIESSWKQTSEKFEYKVTVPANTTGLLYLPAKSAGDIMESGQTLEGVEGIKVLGEKDDRVQIELASGAYHFVSKK
jgi:alpha-L-rhamnosidase